MLQINASVTFDLPYYKDTRLTLFKIHLIFSLNIAKSKMLTLTILPYFVTSGFSFFVTSGFSFILEKGFSLFCDKWWTID